MSQHLGRQCWWTCVPQQCTYRASAALHCCSERRGLAGWAQDLPHEHGQGSQQQQLADGAPLLYVLQPLLQHHFGGQLARFTTRTPRENVLHADDHKRIGLGCSPQSSRQQRLRMVCALCFVLCSLNTCCCYVTFCVFAGRVCVLLLCPSGTACMCERTCDACNDLATVPAPHKSASCSTSGRVHLLICSAPPPVQQSCWHLAGPGQHNGPWPWWWHCWRSACRGQTAPLSAPHRPCWTARTAPTLACYTPSGWRVPSLRTSVLSGPLFGSS